MRANGPEEVGSTVPWAGAQVADAWGVPPSMFGPVPEAVYGLVGRIVMVSALLEESLRDLYCTLARQPQEAAMGLSGSELIKGLRKVLGAVPADHRDQTCALLGDAMTALERRHDVVHSMWPHHEHGPVFGWRGKRAVRATETPARVDWTAISTDDLPAVLRNLLDVQRRCRALLTWVGPRV